MNHGIEIRNAERILEMQNTMMEQNKVIQHLTDVIRNQGQFMTDLHDKIKNLNNNVDLLSKPKRRALF